MRSHDRQSGFALILLIGVTAALAILAAVLVMMLDNQQHSTSKERTNKITLSDAEAALNSAIMGVESDSSWLTTPFNTAAEQSEMCADYTTPAGATVTYAVYDNQNPINTAIQYDQNGDGEVWVQITTTYRGRTTVVRQLVQSKKTISVLPYSAAWTDTNMTLSGTSNIYAVNADGTPDTSGAPYATTIMCGGNFKGNSSADLAAPSDTTNTQSVGLQVPSGNTVSGLPSGVTHTTGAVGLLSDYFDQAHQAAVADEAQTCQNNVSTLFDLAPPTVCTSATALLAAMTYNSTTKTYTASGDLEYNNTSTALTLSTAGTTYDFQKLYVNGSLTLSGNVTVNTTALYVSSGFTISGLTTAETDQFGPIYCNGLVSWKGGSGNTRLGVKTTNYLNSGAAPGPMFAKILSVDGKISSGSDNGSYDGSSGPWDIVLGDVWIDGDAGTSDVAVDFSGPSSGTASTLMCPLLATTEQTHSNGLVNVGTRANPWVYYMECDNDGGYVNTCGWASTGETYGLMILFEAECVISGSPSGSAPNVDGAVLEGAPYVSGSDTGTDLTLSGSASICYDPTVINNIGLNSILTTTVQPVSGTWQEIKGS